MESANPFSRLRQWWASHLPPLKRPSPTRFFVWLALSAASAAALATLSPGWVQVGLLLLITANVVLDGIRPSRVRPAPDLTLRELFLFSTVVLVLAALLYLAAVSLPPMAAPSPHVARIAIGVIWIAAAAHNWRRAFPSSTVVSA